jgi:hypothetical protein
MNRFAILLVLPLTVFPLVAAQNQMPPTGKMDMQTMMKDCPMALPGTNLTTSDSPGGIAVNITTKPENVSELRRRIEHMAGMHGGAYEPIENGARLTLTPKDPGKLGEFRDQVRTHVEQMKKGGCSMMQGMISDMSKPKPEPKPEPKTDETDHSAHHPEGRP